MTNTITTKGRTSINNPLSRREALKLGATGLAASLLSALPFAANAKESSWPTRSTSRRDSLSVIEVGQENSLKWKVFLAPSIPAITSDLPPGETERPWPPISSTLISGERDAVLVDTPITVEQARALANWVAASGKNLTTIYATHGHGDHFFGTSTVLEQFPGVRFVARPEVVEIMRQQASPESLATYGIRAFPARFPASLQSPKS